MKVLLAVLILSPPLPAQEKQYQKTRNITNIEFSSEYTNPKKVLFFPIAYGQLLLFYRTTPKQLGNSLHVEGRARDSSHLSHITALKEETKSDEKGNSKNDISNVLRDFVISNLIASSYNNVFMEIPTKILTRTTNKVKFLSTSKSTGTTINVSAKIFTHSTNKSITESASRSSGTITANLKTNVLHQSSSEISLAYAHIF